MLQEETDPVICAYREALEEFHVEGGASIPDWMLEERKLEEEIAAHALHHNHNPPPAGPKFSPQRPKGKPQGKPAIKPSPVKPSPKKKATAPVADEEAASDLLKWRTVPPSEHVILPRVEPGSRVDSAEHRRRRLACLAALDPEEVSDVGEEPEAEKEDEDEDEAEAAPAPVFTNSPLSDAAGEEPQEEEARSSAAGRKRSRRRTPSQAAQQGTEAFTESQEGHRYEDLRALYMSGRGGAGADARERVTKRLRLGADEDVEGEDNTEEQGEEQEEEAAEEEQADVPTEGVDDSTAPTWGCYPYGGMNMPPYGYPPSAMAWGGYPQVPPYGGTDPSQIYQMAFAQGFSAGHAQALMEAHQTPTTRTFKSKARGKQPV
ncbi:hypothetical protein PAPYR_2247 [Paratrimastix pyriformis]|uniref:Uncharacterized protein n=1 Tax=Paratrimastix pyriformis TaxID=342808 RepID=A0ABQ8UWS2_9EUKA|nr:hypothetical protein PAPYR_2247 [Paratrimastix pyriformis]